MKQKIKRIRPYLPWLFLLALVEVFAAVFLWLADIHAFRALLAALILSGILLFGTLCCLLCWLERRREEAMLSFIEHPDPEHEEHVLRWYGGSQQDLIRAVGERLREQEHRCKCLDLRLKDYEEYVESWVHETKMPLSLLTLLIDHHGEELPGKLTFKLDHVRDRMQEYIFQMLFYARLKGARRDYRLEALRLADCVEELLEEYALLLAEKGLTVQKELSDVEVYTDRKALWFILRQLIGNSIKYSLKDPMISFCDVRTEEGCWLIVRDNGRGVKSCDLPYIFEKGFTGDPGGLKEKTTGMGLYLARELAGELNIGLSAFSEWQKGFEMRIFFPAHGASFEH